MSPTQEIIKNYQQQLTDNSYQKFNKITDKQLTVKQSADEIKNNLHKLAVPINERFAYAVVGYIQLFGWLKVLRWAEIASTKNKPEHYFMRILSNQKQKSASDD